MPVSHRNAGLDLLRCCAILPVIAYHTPIRALPLEQWGYIGVEIFFALSGFLVAQMLVERFDGVRTSAALAAFLVNRWMRTLPLYYLFLALTIWATLNLAAINPQHAPLMGGFERLPDVTPYFVFAQNLWDGGRAANANWFGVSWTLTLEEWFYLLFAVVMFAFRHKPVVRSMTVLALGLVAAALMARTWRHLDPGPGDFEDLFRRPVLFRLDALCYGTLTYVLMLRYPAAIKAWRAALALAGIAVLVPVLLNHPLPGHTGVFGHVLFWTLAPVSICLMVPAFYHAEITSPAVASVAAFVSTRTYALYLSHLLVALVFAARIAEITAWTVLPLLALELGVADLIYRTLERPLLRCRPASALAWTTGPARMPHGRRAAAEFARSTATAGA